MLGLHSVLYDLSEFNTLGPLVVANIGSGGGGGIPGQVMRWTLSSTSTSSIYYMKGERPLITWHPVLEVWQVQTWRESSEQLLQYIRAVY